MAVIRSSSSSSRCDATTRESIVPATCTSTTTVRPKLVLQHFVTMLSESRRSRESQHTRGIFSWAPPLICRSVHGKLRASLRFEDRCQACRQKLQKCSESRLLVHSLIYRRVTNRLRPAKLIRHLLQPYKFSFVLVGSTVGLSGREGADEPTRVRGLLSR